MELGLIRMTLNGYWEIKVFTHNPLSQTNISVKNKVLQAKYTEIYSVKIQNDSSQV